MMSASVCVIAPAHAEIDDAGGQAFGQHRIGHGGCGLSEIALIGVNNQIIHEISLLAAASAYLRCIMQASCIWISHFSSVV